MYAVCVLVSEQILGTRAYPGLTDMPDMLRVREQHTSYPDRKRAANIQNNREHQESHLKTMSRYHWPRYDGAL